MARLLAPTETLPICLSNATVTSRIAKVVAVQNTVPGAVRNLSSLSPNAGRASSVPFCPTAVPLPAPSFDTVATVATQIGRVVVEMSTALVVPPTAPVEEVEGFAGTIP